MSRNLVLPRILPVLPRRNPVAHAPILRKGGAHGKAAGARRQSEKRGWQREVLDDLAAGRRQLGP